VLLGGLVTTAVLYLALNAAFVQVLPLERIAASNLVARTSWSQSSGRALEPSLPAWRCWWCSRP